MYQIGDVVSYGTTGVCSIVDIRMDSMTRAGKKQEFYILQPLATPTCTTMVPTGNETLLLKMRRVLTKDEIDAMLTSVRGQRLAWIEDTRQRAETYTQILSDGITGELLKLISCLYLEKKSRSQTGRKFCLTDEKLLSSAQRMVSEEFAYSLQIPKNQVAPYIAERMEAV